MKKGIDSVFNPNSEKIAKEIAIQEERKKKKMQIDNTFRLVDSVTPSVHNENLVPIKKPKQKIINKDKDLNLSDSIESTKNSKEIGKIIENLSDQFTEILMSEESDEIKKNSLGKLLNNLKAQPFEDSSKNLLVQKIENWLENIGKDQNIERDEKLLDSFVIPKKLQKKKPKSKKDSLTDFSQLNKADFKEDNPKANDEIVTEDDNIPNSTIELKPEDKEEPINTQSKTITKEKKIYKKKDVKGFNKAGSQYENQKIYDNSVVDVNEVITNDNLSIEKKIAALNVVKNKLDSVKDDVFNLKQLSTFISKKINRLEADKKSIEDILTHSEGKNEPLEKIENIQSEDEVKDGVISNLENSNKDDSSHKKNEPIVTREETDFILNSLDKDSGKDDDEIIELTDIVQPESKKEKVNNYSEENINKLLEEGKILKVKVRRTVDTIDDGWVINRLENGKAVVEKTINGKKKTKTLPLSEIESLNFGILKPTEDDSYYADTEAAIGNINKSDNSGLDAKSKEKDEYEDLEGTEGFDQLLEKNSKHIKTSESGAVADTEAFYAEDEEVSIMEEVKSEMEKELVDYPELKKEIDETLGELFDKTPKYEKTTIFEHIGNLGYRTSELKNKTMAYSIGIIADRFKNKNNFAAKYLKNFGNIYKKSASNDRKMIEMAGKGKISSTVGVGKGAGVLARYGRVAYDFLSNGSLKTLNPLRHSTAIAMSIGRIAEAAKETRFESEEAIKNTRVSDYDRAYEEAWNIYEKAANLHKDGIVNVEDLEKAYHEQLPEDIIRRFERGGVRQTAWYKLCIDKSVGVRSYAEKLIKKLEKIEKNDSFSTYKKNKKRKELLARSEALIKDLDRMVGDSGAVDTISFVSRSVERSGKNIANVMMIDSIRMMAQNIWNLNNIFKDYSDEIEKPNGEGDVSGTIPDGAQTEVDSLDKHNISNYGRVNKDQWVQEQTARMGQTEIDTGNLNEVDPRGRDVASDARIERDQWGKEQAAHVDVKIGGKIDTYSEAAYEAVKKASPETQEAFIRRILGNDTVIADDKERVELIKKAVRILSVSNAKFGDGDDVANLVYEGNVVRLDADGKIEVLKGDGIKEASVVSEKELSKNELKLKEVRNEISAETAKDFEKFKSHPSSIINLKNNETELSSADQKNLESHIISERANKEAVEASAAYEKITKEQTLRSDVINTEEINAKAVPEKLSEDQALKEEITFEKREYAILNNVPENLYDKMSEELKDEYNEFLSKYDDDEVPLIIKDIPLGIKNDAEKSLDYLKIVAGNSADKSDGFANLFGLTKPPAEDWGFEHDVKNDIYKVINGRIGGREGMVILYDNDNKKIGVEVEGGGSLGIKPTKWYEFSKPKKPDMDLSTENIEKIKKYVREYNSGSIITKDKLAER